MQTLPQILIERFNSVVATGDKTNRATKFYYDDLNEFISVFNRRAVFFDLYTADQVHLLPGYPKNSSGTLLVAFYVQQPLGLFIGNISVLPRSTLVVIVTTYKSALENATGTIIKGVAFFIVPTTPLTTTSTETPVEEDSDDWKWIVIGVCVGVVVIVLIIVIVFWW